MTTVITLRDWVGLILLGVALLLFAGAYIYYATLAGLRKLKAAFRRALGSAQGREE